MHIEPIGTQDFGASVSGVVLSALTETYFAALNAAFLKFGFLVFPSQSLSEAEQISFGARALAPLSLALCPWPIR